MKKSEQLRAEASQEENDIKALGIYNKSMREARLERFEEFVPKLNEKGFIIATIDGGTRFTIDTQSTHGIVDYYPKANKILIRKKNKWIKPGLQWIVKNLLK